MSPAIAPSTEQPAAAISKPARARLRTNTIVHTNGRKGEGEVAQIDLSARTPVPSTAKKSLIASLGDKRNCRSADKRRYPLCSIGFPVLWAPCDGSAGLSQTGDYLTTPPFI